MHFTGKDRFMALKASFLATGLTTRVHGNTRLPKHALKLNEAKNLVVFLSNYKEEYAILPSLIPGGMTSSYNPPTQPRRYSSGINGHRACTVTVTLNSTMHVTRDLHVDILYLCDCIHSYLYELGTLGPHGMLF